MAIVITQPYSPIAYSLAMRHEGSSSGTHHFAWLNDFDSFQSGRDERQQIFNCVAGGRKHYDCESSLRKILLELQVLIAGQQDRESRVFGCGQQCAIL